MRESEPLYVISVAARLLGLHPQTLRKYERAKFVEPSRTAGNLRLYSSEDIDRLRQVNTLVKERDLNLAGVQMALQLTEELRRIVGELRSKRRSDYDAIASALEELLEMMGAPTETAKDRGPVEVRVRVNRESRRS